MSQPKPLPQKWKFRLKMEGVDLSLFKPKDRINFVNTPEKGKE